MSVRPGTRRQRGAALLIMLAILGMGASWLVLSQLNAQTGGIEAVRKKQNAEVLNRAKQALIGYVAAQAAKSGEDRPGALPCPEAPGSYGDGTNEGTVSYPCALPITGRFPWKTLGLDKLVDASGEPLWYAVASGWAGASTVINSNCASYDASSSQACRSGRLTVDGTTSDVIALIIAPGAAFNVAAATGCTAQPTQTRPSTGTPNVLSYLECENATAPGNTFVTTGPGASFNDQVITITAAELLPGIEAAIADRIEREIVPLINATYTSANWGLTGGDRVYPYAAPFGNPDTSDFLGTAGTTAGLLPLATQNCVAGSSPRCNTTLVSWSDAAPTVSYGSLTVPITTACSYAGATGTASCNGSYLGVGLSPSITVSGPQRNGAMSLRQLNAGATGTVVFFDLTSFAISFTTPSPAVVLNNDGTFTVSITVTPPAPAGLAAVLYWIFVPGNATSDHSLLDATTASATGWFLRNEWHKLTYYALAPGFSANGAAPRSCATGSTCLSITNVTPAGGQRAALILAGRSINGSARPSTAPADYLEFGNATGTFEKQPVSNAVNLSLRSPFNDRLIVVGSN